MSRRRFLKTAGVSTALALGSGFGLHRLANAAPPVGGPPKPIPGGTDLGGGLFLHFFLPTEILIPGAPNIKDKTGDPSTITDFNGTVGVFECFGGIGQASGSENGTQYWAADVRFIDGEYVDVAGNYHQGTFGFIWLDVFEDEQLLVQIHDINPGGGNPGPACPADEQDKPLWTTKVPSSSVHVNPGSGRASMHISNLSNVADYFDVINAFFCGPSVPASTSFSVEWEGVEERYNIRNRDVGFAGEFVVNSARLEWSASNGNGYHFDAQPFDQGFALVGKMRNGVFYP